MVSDVMWRRYGFPLITCLGLVTPGCLATRGWVRDQLALLSDRTTQVEGRVGALETRIEETDSRVAGISERLDHLRLERRFVLNLREGANFAPNSGQLTPEARAAIDGFLTDLPQLEAAVFVVAGHTDNLGAEEYNDELGQRRATSVARYLIARGVDPSRVTAVSYGERMPLADNATEAGRRQNRRVEILVYQEVIASSGRTAQPASEARHRDKEASTIKNDVPALR